MYSFQNRLLPDFSEINDFHFFIQQMSAFPVTRHTTCSGIVKTLFPSQSQVMYIMTPMLNKTSEQITPDIKKPAKESDGSKDAE